MDIVKPDKADKPDQSKVIRIGSGGRLYRDARLKDVQRVEETEAKVKELLDKLPEDHPAPPSPPPWTVKPMHEEPKPPRDWQALNSTVLEVVGIGVLSAGFAMWELWLGVVVLGIGLIALGVALGLPNDGKHR